MPNCIVIRLAKFGSTGSVGAPEGAAPHHHSCVEVVSMVADSGGCSSCVYRVGV